MELIDMKIGEAYEEQFAPGYVELRVRQRYNEDGLRKKRGFRAVVLHTEIGKVLDQIKEIWDGQGRLDYSIIDPADVVIVDGTQTVGVKHWRTIAGEYTPPVRTAQENRLLAPLEMWQG